jgi:hypothetical protein
MNKYVNNKLSTHVTICVYLFVSDLSSVDKFNIIQYFYICMYVNALKELVLSLGSEA